MAAPITGDASGVSAEQPAVAPTIRRGTLILGAAVRGKPSKPAAKLIGVNLGDEFADIRRFR